MITINYCDGVSARVSGNIFAFLRLLISYSYDFVFFNLFLLLAVLF